MSAESAQPCGCDAGANWICEFHRTRAAQHVQEMEAKAFEAIAATKCFFCDYALHARDTYCCPKCGWKVHVESGA